MTGQLLRIKFSSTSTQVWHNTMLRPLTDDADFQESDLTYSTTDRMSTERISVVMVDTTVTGGI
jgi:hypothetical protein